MEALTVFVQSLTLFGVVWAFWAMLVVFIIALFLLDITEGGIQAFVVFTIYVGLLFFWSSFDLFSIFTWANVGTYLGIGFGYAILRVFIYGRKERNRFEKEKGTYFPHATEKGFVEKRSDRKESMKSELKNNTFRWWFLWPVSLINWVFTDLLKDVWDIIYKKLAKFANSIFDLGWGKD